MKTEYVTNGDHTNIHVHMKSYNGKQFCHKKEKKRYKCKHYYLSYKHV